jgi:Short C-terminal domain
MTTLAELDRVRRRLGLRGPRLAYRSLYARLPAQLGDGETVVAFGDGYVVGAGLPGTGAYVVLTNRRLLALHDEVAEIGLDAVTHVEPLASGGSGVLGFTGGGFTLFAPGKIVARVRPKAAAEAMLEALGARTPVEPSAGDPLDAIRRLGELRDAGLVSPEEFSAKKAELLARV